MTRASKIPILLCGLSLCLTAACHRDPNVRANQSVARGDKYAAHGQLKEATIEYRRALQATPARADIHVKLAQAYAALGNGPDAYREYTRAADLDGSRVDAQVQAGVLLLGDAQFDEAKARAEQALAVEPGNVAAHILLGNALAGLHDTTHALKQMQEAVALDPTNGPAYAALGSVQHEASSPAARESFAKAITLQPRSIDARLALANYDWATGDHSAAEQDLTSARAIDPRDPDVLRASALFYVSDNRVPEAEPYFRAFAAESTAGTLALSDYLAGVGKSADALTVLQPLTGVAQYGRAARIRIASITAQQGHRDAALALVDALEREQPSDADVRMLEARLRLAPPADPAGAWAAATAAVKSSPDSASAQYTLGLAALARRDRATAEGAFKQALLLNPSAAAASLQLARLRLDQGDASGALNAAEAAAADRPDDIAATLVLARSLHASGDLDRARRVLSSTVERMPGSGDVTPLLVELGWVDLDAKQPDAARAAFERVLAPASADRPAPVPSAGSIDAARRGAVAADEASHDLRQAHARVDGWLAASPSDPTAQILAAGLDQIERNPASAERRLLDVLRAHPDRLEAYELLGSLYVDAVQGSAALDKYRALAARAPDADGPATMVGILLEGQGDRTGAIAQYQAVLARSPRAAVAANNLAWLLAENGRLDEARTLSQVAIDALRGRPEPLDTLGWIELKAHHGTEALASFQRALDLAPENHLYTEHLQAARLEVGKQ